MEPKQLIRKITQYKEGASPNEILANFRVISQKDLEDVDRDLFEERAAIIQFEGGFTKDQADYLALNDHAVSRSILINRQRRLFKPRTGTPASPEFVKKDVMDRINEIKKISSSLSKKSALFSNKGTQSKVTSELPSSVKEAFKNRLGRDVAGNKSRHPSPLHMEIGDYSTIPF